MKPHIHAQMDVKRFGGKIEDYIPIHEFIDSSYHCIPDVRHRALLHNQFGLMMVEKLFGQVMVNSDGRRFCPRDIAEGHIVADLGRLPSVEDYFRNMKLAPWMSGSEKKRRVIPIYPGDKSPPRRSKSKFISFKENQA
jgi:hypothetical protein